MTTAATDRPPTVTQTEIFTLQDGDSNKFDREIKSIKLAFGRLVVSGNGKDKILKDDQEVTFDNASALSVFAPEGPCSFAVVFAENAVAPVFQNITAVPAEIRNDAAVRGDADSATNQTGSYESRTVTELRTLAKERDLGLPSKANKKALIKALRA